MGLFEVTSPGGGFGGGPTFDVRTEMVDDCGIRVVVAGDIDLATSHLLRDRLMDALTRDGLDRVEVDLSPVRMLDASGVGALLAARKQAESRGLQFHTSGAAGLPRRVLEILGLLHILGDK